MTGQEKDRETLFERITEQEALASAYRDAHKRRKAGRQDTVHRVLSRGRSLARHAARSLGIRRSAPSRPIPEGDLGLDRMSAAERKDLYFRGDRIVVYTALFGDYDVLREPLFHPDNIDYFVITDREIPKNSLWMKSDLSGIPQEIRRDPVLCNRWCKMHPHVLFPGFRYSIYIDANIWVLSDLTPLIATLDRFPVAMFRHKHRDCVYEEVEACIRQKKADPASLKAHEELIRSHGIPEHWGLLEASVIPRKHGDLRCVSLMEAWWEAFRQNSKRDQISLIDCLWTAGIEPARIGVLGSNLQKCDLFLQLSHNGPAGSDQPLDLEDLIEWISRS